MSRKILLLSLIVLSITACRSKNDVPVAPGQPLRELTALEKQIVNADNAFGFKLLREVNTAERQKNVFLSPFSVSFALGMTLNGAEGTTLDSIKYALGLTGMSNKDINESYKTLAAYILGLDSKVTVSIANSIWYDASLTVVQQFIDDNRTYFNAEVTQLNFASPDALTTINGWVDTKTNHLIPTIIDQIPRETVMYLINALYFKGAWKYLFKVEDTKDAQFTTAAGTKVPCNLMSQRMTFRYADGDDAQAVMLPYGSDNFAMIILLPHADADIDVFAEGLTEQRWNALISAMKETEIDLFMPRFKLEYGRELKDQLSAMGMGVAFSAEADFSRINPSEGLSITRVLHKTFVEVNEEGTEAAGVTAVEISRTSLPSTPTMRIDRPFIFGISDRHSGTLLFIGKIVQPS